MTLTKTATTTYPVLDLIKKRWSTRSFSEKTVGNEELMTLIEAAGWMFSANNEQPWRYIIGQKNTAAYDAILQSLAPGNAAWAKHAAAFIVAVAKTDFDKDGHPANLWAEHDLGAANAALVLQATSMNLYAHLMAGFDAGKIKSAFSLAGNLKPLVVIALGYKDEPEKLEEPFKSRELAPRQRKRLQEIIL
jgi:nitroreductase